MPNLSLICLSLMTTQLPAKPKSAIAGTGGLGGIMIWELSQDFFPDQIKGQQSPLLQALSNSLATPQILSANLIASNFIFSFSTLPLAQYHVLFATNLASEPWQTLTNYLEGSGSPVTVTGAVTALYPSAFIASKRRPDLLTARSFRLSARKDVGNCLGNVDIRYYFAFPC